MRRVASCLHVKLADVASGTLSRPLAVFRSSDGKEWVTTSIGPVSGPQQFPPTMDHALSECVVVAVADGLTATGARSVKVTGLTVAPLVSAVVARSLDLRVTSAMVTPFGIPAMTFVDLVWLGGHEQGGVIDVVNQTYGGDLQSADDGLVAQVTDAVARRLAGI
jgi:hypothetical protein